MPKTLKITNECWKKLLRKKLELIEKEGRSLTFSQVIEALLEEEV
jgi:predicted CopG family antitoxin